MSEIISVAIVKELRERTGAGMMDCKHALIEVDGKLERAIEVLREKGLASAPKKSGRFTAEGQVFAELSSDQRVGVLVEMNCETDFAAKNSGFKQLLHETSQLIIQENPIDQRMLMDLTLPSGQTVEESLNSLITMIGENMTIRRFVRFEAYGNGKVDYYIHNDYLTEGKVGVLVEVHTVREDTLLNTQFHTLTKDLALQVASAKPDYIRREDVPVDILEEEEAIYKAQALNEGKSVAVADRIMQGKLEKFYKEVCLMEQPFIKDPVKTISEWINEMNAAFDGEQINVAGFARFEKGEGIGKKRDDFADEVMAQMKNQ